VAVDVGVGDAQRAGDPAAARNVLDDHLLAQRLAEIGLQVARETVERATGRKRDHHRHGTGRPILRHDLGGSEHGCSCKREKNLGGAHFGSSLALAAMVGWPPSYRIALAQAGVAAGRAMPAIRVVIRNLTLSPCLTWIKSVDFPFTWSRRRVEGGADLVPIPERSASIDASVNLRE
jgi:hypothetical protein